MPNVLFAGYKVPRPLHPYFIIKLQTDGSEEPTKVLSQACTKLIGQLSSLEAKFQREFSFRDARVDGAPGDDPYGTSTGGGQAWGAGRDYLDF
jgi:DNA-directed RNA polymerase II subunit RPB11